MKTLGHYCQQMKVTRLPGRDPAGWHVGKFGVRFTHLAAVPIAVEKPK
jgi:hypothetical protein